jgi:capsular exopolysaccharide synthesis family protein
MPQEASFPEPSKRPPAERPEPNPVAGRIEAALREPLAPAPALASTPTVPDLLRALRRRWMTALALGGTLAAVAAVAVWYLMTPKYTAFAQIRVLSAPPSIYLDRERNSQASFLTYLRAQASQFKSRNVIQAALKRDDVKRLNLDANYASPVQYIEEELKVEIQDGSEFMTPKMNSSDANEAMTIVKGLTAAYMDEIVYAEQRARVAAVAELDKAYNEANDSLKAKKKNLERLAEQFHTTSDETLTLVQRHVLEQLTDAKQARNATTNELFKAQAMLNAHRLQMEFMKQSKVADVQVEAALKADPEAVSLKGRIEKLDNVIQHYLDNAINPKAEPGYTSSVRLKSELEEKLAKRRDAAKKELLTRTDEKFLDEHDANRAPLENTIAMLEQHGKDLEKKIADLTDQAERFPRGNSELASLRGEIQSDERLVADLAKRRAELGVELRAGQRISVYQEADLEKRDAKKQIAATIIAPIGVFFLACMGVGWVEYRHRRIHSAGEVARGLGIRVVGSIPNRPNLERCLVGPDGETDVDGHPVLESIDAIRTLVLHQSQAAATRVVMVTSAAEGEGKTTLASHLAGSLARAGRKTLLVDADLRQPAVHQLFEAPLQPGFSEVLLGEVEVADAIQSTTIDGLSIVAAGQWDREVIQALARGGLEGVFEKLREEFDFIIVDSHPVLAAADALLIGQHADAVLMSVLKQVSQMPRVYTASQRLSSLDIRVLGAVVSGADPDEIVEPPSASAVEQAWETRL